MNKRQIISKLIEISNVLDTHGAYRDADVLTAIGLKVAQSNDLDGFDDYSESDRMHDPKTIDHYNRLEENEMAVERRNNGDRPKQIRYDYSASGPGGTITRLSDGEDIWLQGDDWNSIEAELDACFTGSGRIRRMPDGEPKSMLFATSTFD